MSTPGFSGGNAAKLAAQWEFTEMNDPIPESKTQGMAHIRLQGLPSTQALLFSRTNLQM
jgi:hypothetical protein